VLILSYLFIVFNILKYFFVKNNNFLTIDFSSFAMKTLSLGALYFMYKYRMLSNIYA